MKIKKDKNLYRLFLWGWCSMCGAHIVCPECGNNCCNGMFGDIGPDGKPCNGSMKPDSHTCTVCNLAYQYQHFMCKLGHFPKTKRQIAKFNKEIEKQDG